MDQTTVTRRKFLKLGVSMGAVAGLVAYARWVEALWLGVVRRRLPVRGYLTAWSAAAWHRSAMSIWVEVSTTTTSLPPFIGFLLCSPT